MLLRKSESPMRRKAVEDTTICFRTTTNNVPPVVINSCIWAIVTNTAAEMQKDNRFLRRKEICDTEFLEIATRVYNELLGFAARKYEILDIGE